MPRWFHVIAAISWIGGSLNLLWLDCIFANSERRAKGEHGEPWLIDLVGSLFAEKLKLSLGGLEKTHIWLKRETTLTWVSGLLLLVMVAKPLGGGLLTGADGEPMDGVTGTAIIAAFLILFWGGFDLLWRMLSIRRPIVLDAFSYAVFVGTAFSLTWIFSAGPLSFFSERRWARSCWLMSG